ncbi:MAG: HmuY family protein [Flavobacteriales bacterium]|nr:HmuY family protein [Flavobacteriales bacterium]
MKTAFPYLLFILPFLTSCLKEETPLPKPKPGNVETVVIEIGFPYLNQVYYDCETNNIVSKNTKYDWDLSFESSTSGYHVLLNTAVGMYAANMGSTDFNSISSISGASWQWDNPNGDLNSTAIGNWIGKNEVFIIDRQYDDNGNHMGYMKFQLITVTDISYTFKFANLDGTNETTYTISKNYSKNFVHFSFEDNGKTIELEPEKNSWDLLFTNHQHKFDNLTMPFVLTQTLTNKHNGVLVAEDNNNNFSKIKLEDTLRYSFTNNWDEIGHDWKIRNNTNNSFTIDGNKSYIVKTTKGYFYKMRFIDFYNHLGQKGYPTFEIQRL